MSFLSLAKRIEREMADATARRIDLLEAVEVLNVMHAEIRAIYVPGALAWGMAQPDLRRRFDASEQAIDRLAGDGPTSGQFQQAVENHAAVWRELLSRFRAHQEQE